METIKRSPSTERSSDSRSTTLNLSSLHRSLYSSSSPHSNIISHLLHDQASPASLTREQYIDSVFSTATGMHCIDVKEHHGCVNSIDFSNHGEEYMATGGDDRRVLVWRVADLIHGCNVRPITMATTHMSNIFTLDFSCDNAFIYSGGDDAEVVKHDFATGQCVSTIHGLDSVYCVDAHPSCPAVVMTASEDGCVYIVDTRGPARFIAMSMDNVLCESTKSYQCVSINPMDPCLVAVSNGHNGTALYDTRQRKQVLSYKSTDWPVSRENSVSVCFNKTGRQLFALYRQSPPCLFDIWGTKPLHRFVDQTGCYRNRVTLKSGCFMGPNDEYVVSGSDDFRVYIWKIPEPQPMDSSCERSALLDSLSTQVEPHLILPGHRSIVNQVRYSDVHKVMATSGVEKVVKIWSPLPLNGNDIVQESRAPPSRQRFTSEQVHDMAHHDEPQELLESTEEDPTVLALFDALVDQDESGHLPSTSTDSTSSSIDIGDDDSYFLQHASSDDLLSSSDSENMAFGAMPSSSRSFWLDLPYPLGYLSSSSDSLHSTLSELSVANTSSIEPPWSDIGMEEMDRETRGDGESEIEPLNESECDSDDSSCPHVRENINSSNGDDSNSLDFMKSPLHSNSSAHAQSTVLNCQKNSKSNSIFEITGSSNEKEAKLTSSKSSIDGNSSVSHQSLSSIQDQSMASGCSHPNTSNVDCSANGTSSSTRKPKTKSKRQLLISRSESSPNYEQYSRDDFIKEANKK